MNTQPLQRWWAGLPAKDRRALAIASTVLAAFAMWQWGLAPAWRKLQNIPQQLIQARADLQHMQAQAQEAKALQARGNEGPNNKAQTAAAVQRITQGTLGASAEVLPLGQGLQVKLSQVPADALAAWLAQIRTQARVVVQEVDIQVAGEPGAGTRWNGKVLLAGGGLQNP
jgi:general secretion pathway protein M